MVRQIWIWDVAVWLRWHLPFNLGNRVSRAYHRLNHMNYSREGITTTKSTVGETFKSYDLLPHEPDFTLKYIQSKCSDGNVIYDVGANVGDHAIPLAKSFSDSLVVAFEPDPVTRGKLLSNIDANPETKTRIDVREEGVGSSHGGSKFYRAVPPVLSSFDRQQIQQRNGKLLKRFLLKFAQSTLSYQGRVFPNPIL